MSGMSLPKLSVTRRVAISMFIMVLVLFGGVSFLGLGLDMMPDMEFPMLNVATAYPGCAAEDIEQLVTRNIEGAVAGVKGIKKLSSTSAEGLSTVTIEFDWGVDLDNAANDVREAINRVKRFMPDDIYDPMVMKFDMSQMPILIYGVTGMENTVALQKYFEDAIAPRVERLPGVASVMVVGGPVREINVYLNKVRLDQYKIGPEAVMGVLRASNMNVSSGNVSAGHQEFLVRTMGEYKDLETISNTVITMVNGAPIRIGDVARVEDTFKERRGYARMNGIDGVIFVATKQSGANTLEAVESIRNLFVELKPILEPLNIELSTIFDQGEMVERVVNNAVQSAVTGAILAVVILLLFLRNWRPTMVIALAIPISILTTFIGMYAMGYTFNVITIGGFALVVGMLVDNAVVVIENIYRHLEEGKHRNQAAVIGANEMSLAIGASTLTTVAVFVPLALAGGMAGVMARPLALTICAGLFASLLVAITIVPMFASVIFKKKQSKKQVANDTSFQAEAHGGRVFHTVQKGYVRMLGWVLSHRLIVALIVIGMIGLAALALRATGAEFMADADRGMGSIAIKMPVGTNLEETNRLVSTIEERIKTIPEVRSVGVMVGRLSEQGGMGGGDVNEATVFFRLKQFKDRNRSTKQVTDEIRKAVPELHGVEFNFGGSGMMGSSTPIEIKFFGNDLERLKAYADSAAAIMGEIKMWKKVKVAVDSSDVAVQGKKRKDEYKWDSVTTIHDIIVSMGEGKPEMRITPDRDRMASMGFTMAEVGTGIMYANLGQVVTKYRVDGEEYDVRIRLEEEDRSTVDKVTQIPVVSRTGVVTQVVNLGDIEYERGPIEIGRENRVRVVTVTAQTNERDIQGQVEMIKKRLEGMEAEMPNGYFIEYGGSYKDMQESFSELLLAMILAVVLVYMVMAAQFESFTQPFVVMFTVPLAFIGVAFGLYFMGHPLSVSGFMGIIILVGIVVNNGIVLISTVNQLRAEGRNMRDALIHACELRLRPILITSLTTIFGMLPMAISTGQGSEMQAPMGIAVSFGLTASTFLTLFVVPIMYSIIDGIAHSVTGFLKRVVLGETHKDKETMDSVPVKA